MLRMQNETAPRYAGSGAAKATYPCRMIHPKFLDVLSGAGTGPGGGSLETWAYQVRCWVQVLSMWEAIEVSSTAILAVARS